MLSLLVEVFGASCAGKSTLIRGMARALHGEGVLVDTCDGERRAPTLRRARDTARGLADARILLWCVLNPSLAVSRHGRIFLRAAGLSERVHRPGSVWLLDEGPLKRLSTLAEGSRRPDLLIRGAPRPDLAVLLTCDFDVRLNRLRAKGRAAASSMTDTELRARDVAKARWNDRIVEALGISVVRLDTTAGRDVSALAVQHVRVSLDARSM